MTSFLHFAHLTIVNVMLVFVLVMAVFFTLMKAKKRLLAQGEASKHERIKHKKAQPWRFAAVCFGNIVLVALISAWLLGLSVATKGQTELTINSEKWRAQHQYGAKLLAQYPSIEKLTISGYGFEKQHWQGFKGIEVEFIPKLLSAGFANIVWPKTLTVGEQIKVQGQWLNPEKPEQVVNVDLVDVTGKTVATNRVRHGESINLSAAIKAPGHFAYRIKATTDAQDRVLAQQSLFIHATGMHQASANKATNRVSPLNILVMQSAPSFETNQLKHWVGSYGAQMLIFTDISKDRFITQSVNRTEGTIAQKLSPQLLATMDLLIMDGRKLVGLPNEQMTIIANAVEQGLGLFVLADSHFIEQTPQWLGTFSFSPVAGMTSNQRVLPVVNSVQSEVSFAVIPYQFSASLASSGSALTVLERTHQNKPLSLLKSYGLGKVAVSLLSRRYQWQQQQKPAMYSGAWQHLFKHISRVERQARFLMPSATAFIYSPANSPANSLAQPLINRHNSQIDLLNEKMPVCLLVNQGLPSDSHALMAKTLKVTVNGKSATLALTQDSHQPSRYCTWYWPTQSGWHLFTFTYNNQDASKSASIGEGKGNKQNTLSHWRYVYDQHSWQTHRQNRRLQDTVDFIAVNVQLEKRVAPSFYQKIAGPWYWWLLMLCATFLWFELWLEHRQRR